MVLLLFARPYLAAASAPYLLHDAAIEQIGDHLMDTINVLDSHSGPVLGLFLMGLLLLSTQRTCFLRVNGTLNINATGNTQELHALDRWDK